MEGEHLPLQLRDFANGRASSFGLVLPARPLIGRLVREIWNPPYSGRGRTLFLRAKVIELLAEVADQVAVPEGASVHWRHVHEARDAVLADLATTPDLVAIAASIGMPVSVLQREFRQAFGETAIRLWTRTRLHHVRNGLEAGALTIKEAAFRLGYSHPNNFITAFRKEFGFPPGTIARACQKT